MDVVGGAIRLPKRIVDPDSLPPYDLIRSMMEQPEFMAEGSRVSFLQPLFSIRTTKVSAKVSQVAHSASTALMHLHTRHEMQPRLSQET